MRVKKSVAVLGGDMRQVHLAQLLQADGWESVTWGLEKAQAPFAASLERALEAEAIVLPLPVCRGNALNLPLTDMELSCDVLLKRLRVDQFIFGGMTRPLAQQAEDGSGLEFLDYYDREEVQILNAVPTAEGAIMRALEKTDYTLRGSNCLVVGYGRIGKVLAHRLHGLGAQVTVAARKSSDLAWIKVYGYRAVHTGNIVEQMGNFDLIFNTVPASVLNAGCLKRAKRDCLLIELASMPGGIDANAVKEYGLQMIEERGLPGIVAARTSAIAIRDGIYHILEERGVVL